MLFRARALALFETVAVAIAAVACPPPDSTVVYCNSRSDCGEDETCSDGICRRVGPGVDGGNPGDAAAGGDTAAGVDAAVGRDANGGIDRLTGDGCCADTNGTDAPGVDRAAADAGGTDGAALDVWQPDRAEPDATQPPASICGDSTRPCRVAVDETVFQHSNLMMMPGLALDTDHVPHLLFNQNLGGFNGYYAVRTGADSWAIEDLPGSVASGGIGIGAGGGPYAVTNGGNFVTSLLRRNSEGWSAIEVIPGQIHGPNGQGVEVDPDGDQVHAAVISSDNRALYALHTNTWTTRELNTGVSSYGYALALSPQREPHLAHIATGGESGWKVYWAAPPAATELVRSLETSGLVRSEIALAVPPRAGNVDRDPHPHLLFALPQSGNPGSHDLMLADRSSNGQWRLRTVAADTPGDDLRCLSRPTSEGETCDYDYDEVRPLAVVADELGNVRHLYSWLRSRGTMRTYCEGSLCFWEPDVDTSTGALRLGWIDGSGAAHDADILTAAWVTAASARIDGLGRIHIVALDRGAPPAGAASIRYLRLEP
ncbi:MAG: hypothetical protein JXR83_13040 [Deltaproteobacteria bacterium]|nr:hypothetical protein [Deltaproteobacteria bacterium]